MLRCAPAKKIPREIRNRIQFKNQLVIEKISLFYEHNRHPHREEKLFRFFVQFSIKNHEDIFRFAHFLRLPQLFEKFFCRNFPRRIFYKRKRRTPRQGMRKTLQRCSDIKSFWCDDSDERTAGNQRIKNFALHERTRISPLAW